MTMAKLTIDGFEVEVSAGMNILNAAATIGIEIPHFCYHPKLSLSGNCRMCLVEIEGVPKLQISCGTPVRDEMVVFTNNEKVKSARAAVLEFQLINHPTDCPVCDQAGECKLQDYYMDHSLNASRLSVDKVSRPRLQDFGSGIVHNDERCITCLRCVRFCEEIPKTGELCAIHRGDHTEISTFEGKPINNRYAGCIVDTCPVGAMTSRDFRFKKRSWFLTKTDSICPGCARGCNICIDHESGSKFRSTPENGKIFRVRPRKNDEVNDTWMCDTGRFMFHDADDSERPLKPLVKQGTVPSDAPWDEALEKAAEMMRKAGKELAILISPVLTCEELFLLGKIAAALGVKDAAFEKKETNKWADFEDEILIMKDKLPNSTGAGLIGVGPRDGGSKYSEIISNIKKGKVKHVLIVGRDPVEDDEKLQSAFAKLETLVVIDWHRNKTADTADVFFPGAAWFEKSGVWINGDSRVQWINQCFPPPGDGREDWKILLELLDRVDTALECTEPGAMMCAEVDTFKGMSWDDIGSLGTPLTKMEKS